MSTTAPPAPRPSVAGRVANDAPISVEAYLDHERSAPKEKSEYLDGWRVQMSGARYEHALIVSNINAALHAQLRDGACRAVTNDLRVAIPQADTYAYPDIVAVCGKPELDEEHSDMLYHPVSIIEVLSPSTGDNDRGEKFARYRRLDTLQDYVLVSQDAVYVEHFARQSGGGWLLREIRDLSAALDLEALDATVALHDAYRDVFDSPDETLSDASRDRSASTASAGCSVTNAGFCTWVDSMEMASDPWLRDRHLTWHRHRLPIRIPDF